MKRKNRKLELEFKQAIKQLDPADQALILKDMEAMLEDPKYKPRKRQGNIISLFERES